MPTENRSSNTEGWIACDDGLHLIQMDKNLSHYGWVFRKIDGGLPYSVREATPHEMAHAQARQHLRIGVAQIAGQAPAPRPHPEPIAWMVGTAIWWTKEEAERDAAATGLPIVGLGPMAGVAPAEQNQSEPVGVESATFMGEPNFQHSIEWYREGISKHWKKICDLRAEVERLRAALKFYADREHYHFESGNWDTVSGEPLNILWCGDDPDFIEDGTVARNALSASAEPSAPVEPSADEVRQQHYDEFMQRRETRAALERKP